MLFQCFGMLQVHENEISLRRCSGGAAHLGRNIVHGSALLSLVLQIKKIAQLQ